MMITLGIPGNVADLICKKTPRQAFDDMVSNGGLPLLELFTFGMYRTDIYRIETGETHHHVTYWENGKVSVTSHGEWAELISLAEWDKPRNPSPDEAMEIFWRYVSEDGAR